MLWIIITTIVLAPVVGLPACGSFDPFGFLYFTSSSAPLTSYAKVGRTLRVVGQGAIKHSVATICGWVRISTGHRAAKTVLKTIFKLVKTNTLYTF